MREHIVISSGQYFIRVGTEEKKIERNGGHQVDEKPTAEVMDGDLPRMGDHFVVVVDERGPKIDEDVDYEHDVHCGTTKGILKKINKKRIVPSILMQRVTRQGVESYLGDR